MRPVEVFPSGDRPESTAGLLRRMALGDEQAFAAFYDRLGPWMLAIARQRLEDRSAEELLEVVFVQIWRSAPRFPRQALEPGAWVVAEIDESLKHWQRAPEPFPSPRPGDRTPQLRGGR